MTRLSLGVRQLSHPASGLLVLLLIQACTGPIADPGFSVIADVIVNADSVDGAPQDAEVVMVVQSDWPDVRTPVRIGKLCGATGTHSFTWSFVDLGCPTVATLVALVSPLPTTPEACTDLTETGEPASQPFPEGLPSVEKEVFEGRTDAEDCEGPNEEHVVLELP
jgi:hypothetical protein